MKIKKVQIKNFKSLRDIEIELRGLTLITGINSSGKSSFIQTLLLLKQNFNVIKNQLLYGHEVMQKVLNKDNNPQTYYADIPLNINGEYVVLGKLKDLFFEESYQEDIIIRITTDSNNFIFAFNDRLEILASGFDRFNIFRNDFQYITTDRIAPNITYGLSDYHLSQNLIGIQGEYTAHYLAHNSHKKLDIEALQHPQAITNHFLENVSLWLAEISNGITVNAKLYNELQQVNLTYSYVYGKNKTNDYSPLNVGFGLTYVLPIIVAILKAKPDDLLIIENPESHLHPAGQSKIAKLCALAVANGVQIIVESHSDHFLNAIRVATKQHLIKPEDSAIYYFSKLRDSMETKVEQLLIDEHGKINENWPKGFFDEYDTQLDQLITW